MPVQTSETAPSVDSILGLVRDRANETERTRRIPDDVVAALRRTGINRLVLPSVLGGLQAPVLDLMDMTERIAAVDGSTAWCAVIGSGSNVFAGYMSEVGAGEVFADPDQGSATMFAPAGRVVETGGRHVLSGRWPFTSNCLHSAWVGLGALIERHDGVDPVPRVVFVRASDLTIEDTWDSVGLRGTGSHHVTAQDVPVDLDRSSTFSTPAWPDGVLWRLPVHTMLLPSLVSVPLGIARGAIDEIARQAREGRTARRGQLADDPISMAELATADARLRGARAALHEAVGEAHHSAARNEAVPRTLQARIYVACLHASDVSVETTSAAHQLGGSAAAYVGSPLLRALGDVEASRQHLMFSHRHLSALGTALVGLDVVYPPFFT
ncbi:MAG TPA: acyl-CoA dehydrogenase family protein [Acidimicrobiales bacterium]|nr:acyl-CoA dehydrogenase family protein [Acidimicrobiales bacterium]